MAYDGQGSSVSWRGTAIGGVLSISGPTGSTTMIETTLMETSSGVPTLAKTFMADVTDYGTVTITRQGTGHINETTKTLGTLSVTASGSASAWSCDAYLMGNSTSISAGAIIITTYVFKLTGRIA